MIPQWQTGIVKQIEEARPGTLRFRVELPDAPVFSFKPGQFVTLDLPISEQRNKRWRSYSIASMPGNDNIIELVVSFVEGGKGSEYLFNEIKPGTQLTLRGPQGVFVLPTQLEHDLYLICTGTGIAPFRSMLHYIRHQQLPHKRIYLIFGTRTQQDLLYYDDMKELEKTLPSFAYHPTLSRQQWAGATGHVHAVYEALARQNGTAPATFMLCGWRSMIDEARQRIVQLGYGKKDIEIELYG